MYGSSRIVRFFDHSTPPHVATLVLVAGVSALSMNLILPSLQSIAEWYVADYALAQLAVSAYLGVVGVQQIILGPLSDRYGRRPVLLVSFAIFVLASIGALFAPNITVFLAFRFVQAVVAAGMVLSRAIVRDMVEPDRAASVIGYVTMGMTLVPMLGPVAGGFLDDHIGWQANFVVLILSGVAIFLLVYKDLGETHLTPSSNFTQQFQSYPELLKSRRFWGFTGIALLASGAFFAQLGGAPFVARELLGISASELGAYFAVVGFGYMAGNYFAGRLSQKVGMMRMMIAGCLIATGGMVLSLLALLLGYFSAPVFFGFTLFIGLGNGITLPSANAGIVSVRPHLAGSASGLSGALTLGGGAAISAGTGAMLSMQSGAYPLVSVQLACSALSLMVAVWLMRLARRLGEI